jgi:hypothetical protein
MYVFDIPYRIFAVALRKKSLQNQLVTGNRIRVLSLLGTGYMQSVFLVRPNGCHMIGTFSASYVNVAQCSSMHPCDDDVRSA